MCEAVYEVDKDIIFMGLAGSKMITAAEKSVSALQVRVFADRAYNDDGTLVSKESFRRSDQGQRSRDQTCDPYGKKKVKVESINGNDIAIKADSICVHGDNPKALGSSKEYP